MASTLNEVQLASGAHILTMDVTADGSLMTTTVERDKNVTVLYVGESIAATAYALLVDVSSTGPHEQPGSGEISFAAMQVDRANSTVGRMSVGVITRIDNTNADITFIRGISFTHGDEPNIIRIENFAPSRIRCEVVAGDTPYIASNSVSLNDTLVQADVALPGPNGNVLPQVGDIVVRFLHTSGGTWNGGVSLLYHCNGAT